MPHHPQSGLSSPAPNIPCPLLCVCPRAPRGPAGPCLILPHPDLLPSKCWACGPSHLLTLSGPTEQGQDALEAGVRRPRTREACGGSPPRGTSDMCLGRRQSGAARDAGRASFPPEGRVSQARQRTSAGRRCHAGQEVELAVLKLRIASGACLGCLKVWSLGGRTVLLDCSYTLVGGSRDWVRS